MKTWTHVGENLWRHRSGSFYVRAQVQGRERWRSLRTSKLAVARLRRADALQGLKVGPEEVAARPDVSLGQCAAVYLRRQQDKGLTRGALKYCGLSVRMIGRQWARFEERRAAEVSAREVQGVVDRLKGRYSARRFNGALWALRGVLDVAVEAGALRENPALRVKPLPVPMRARELPVQAEVARFFACLERPRRAEALAFARVLVLSGMRPESVRRLRVRDVDLEKRLIRWAPVKHNRTWNELPMSAELVQVVLPLVARAEGPDAPLLRIRDPWKSLARASVEAGLRERFSARAMRHWFTTRALEAGLPVSVVAKLRGDRDGGGMLLRTYVHHDLPALRRAVEGLGAGGAEGGRLGVVE